MVEAIVSLGQTLIQLMAYRVDAHTSPEEIIKKILLDKDAKLGSVINQASLFFPPGTII
jgi:hypothetical protein